MYRSYWEPVNSSGFCIKSWQCKIPIRDRILGIFKEFIDLFTKRYDSDCSIRTRHQSLIYNFIVGSGVRPAPFLFYPTLFIKAPLILKIPDPHPFSNLYVSYIHFWCHGNVVDWHPIALLIYHFTYFQPENIPIFSILFCKYKCTTWKSEEPHPL